jgi:hypothetical protein
MPVSQILPATGAPAVATAEPGAVDAEMAVAQSPILSNRCATTRHTRSAGAAMTMSLVNEVMPASITPVREGVDSRSGMAVGGPGGDADPRGG